MSILQIVKWPNKILETPTEPVITFDAELKNLIKDMFETMKYYHGIGLAANQVGINKSLFIVHIPSTAEEERQPWHDKSLVFVNPKIVKMQGKTRFQEGCLSFPDVYEYVQRAAEVWIEAQDENGKSFSMHAQGILAVCIQHEYDHTQGITFLERMSRLKAKLIKKRLLRHVEFDTHINEV